MKTFTAITMIATVMLMEMSCYYPSGNTVSSIITEMTPLPRGRGGHAAGVLNGQIVVVGGSDWSTDRTEKFWLNDSVILTDGIWQPGPSLPHPVAYSQFASDSTGLYLAGGTDGVNDLNTVYHLPITQNATWKQLTPMPAAIASGSGAIVKGKLYVACGWSNQKLTNEMWVLDTQNPNATWQPCQPLPGAKRAFAALAASGNVLYLLGGISPENGSLNVLQDAYRYTPQDDSWVKLKDLPWKGYGWAALPIDDDHLLLTGKADGTITKDIYVIDPSTSDAEVIGQTVIQTTTAPLVAVSPNEFWLVGGEPDANKTRTGVITSIKFNRK